MAGLLQTEGKSAAWSILLVFMLAFQNAMLYAMVGVALALGYRLIWRRRQQPRDTQSPDWLMVGIGFMMSGFAVGFALSVIGNYTSKVPILLSHVLAPPLVPPQDADYRGQQNLSLMLSVALLDALDNAFFYLVAGLLVGGVWRLTRKWKHPRRRAPTSAPPL